MLENQYFELLVCQIDAITLMIGVTFKAYNVQTAIRVYALFHPCVPWLTSQILVFPIAFLLFKFIFSFTVEKKLLICSLLTCK